jgi:predicted nucleic acid-binding protein
MKNGLVIADSGPIFSFSLIDKLDVLTSLFDEVRIPNAVTPSFCSIPF